MVKGNTVYVDEVATTPFTSVADYNPLTIAWYATVDNPSDPMIGQYPVSVGTSSNEVYVALRKPTSRPFETCVYIGSNNAAGATSETAVFDAVWAKFASMSVTKRGGGAALTYYQSYNPDLNFTTANLLQTGDGRCGNWARFFQDTLAAQGIGSSVIGVKPMATGACLMVNNWNFPTTGTGTASAAIDWSKYTNPDGSYTAEGTELLLLVSAYSYIDFFAPSADNYGIDTTTNNSYAFTAASDVTDATGVAGQGGVSNPASIFADHAFVRYNGKWYDPSYGIPYASPSLQSVQDTSIAGFAMLRTVWLKPGYTGKQGLDGKTYVYLMERATGNALLNLKIV
jgi:hypothetical protein